MGSPVYIGLLDSDLFISQGLRFFLSEYFKEKNKSAVFVNEDGLNIADVIFYESSHAMAYFIGKVLQPSEKSAILFSLGKSRSNLTTWLPACCQETLSGKENLQQLRICLDTSWRERERLIGKRHISSPEEELTCRQRQIMRLLAKGITPADISMRLNISVKTVSSHRGAVMKKFGFNRKIELYNWLILRGNEI